MTKQDQKYSLTMLNGATRALAEISTAAQAWQIARDAETARTYARMRNLGTEATNYATGIKAKAMLLLADFIDRGQADGTILRKGEILQTGGLKDSIPQVLDSADNPVKAHWAVKEARKLRDVLAGANIDELVQEANAEGRDFALGGLRLAAAAKQTPEAVVTPPLPDGKYRAIVIDPPWPMAKIERSRRPNQGHTLDYPTMTLDEIADLDVPGLVADGCHLYLWVTHRFLPDGLRILSHWGAHYECVLTWRKNIGFTPFSWMYDTEHVLFGRIGMLPLKQNGLRLSFDAPAIGHSIKPAAFYERVSQASPEPRLDLFAREQHAGFDAWGAGVPA